MVEQISDVRVLRSNAGYYIGTLYLDAELDTWFPYERMSVEYYKTEQDAQDALDNNTFTTRLHP